MKKTISILLTLVMVIALFYGCKNSSSTTATETNSETQTTQSTTEVVEKMKDYLPEPFELKDELLDYFERCGYIFDNWYVAKDTTDEYVFTQGTGDAGLVVNKTNLVFNLGTINGSANCVTYNPSTTKTAFIDIIISANMFDAYEIYDLILSNCPDDLKISGQQLSAQLGSTVGESVDIEKDENYYRLSRYGTANGYLDMIGVSSSVPGNWNPIEIDTEELPADNIVDDIVKKNDEVFIVCNSTSTSSEKSIDIYEIIMTDSDTVRTKNYTLSYNNDELDLGKSNVRDGMSFELVEEDGLVKMVSIKETDEYYMTNTACLDLICDENNKIIGFEVEGGERFDEIANEDMIEDCLSLK